VAPMVIKFPSGVPIFLSLKVTELRREKTIITSKGVYVSDGDV
jgi:hypothetical protein